MDRSMARVGQCELNDESLKQEYTREYMTEVKSLGLTQEGKCNSTG